MSEKSENIHTAMVAIMRDIGSIGKDRKNESLGGYMFRGIDDVYNSLHPIMCKYGVFILTKVISTERTERKNKDGKILGFVIATCEFSFVHEGGTSLTVIQVGEGMDSGDKATPKALSGALKYCLFQTFMIPTSESKDSENDSYTLADDEKATAYPGGITETEDLDPKEVHARELAENVMTEQGQPKYTTMQIANTIRKARAQGKMDDLIAKLESEQ